MDPIIKVTKEERVNKREGVSIEIILRLERKKILKNQQEQSFGFFECVIKVQKKGEGYWDWNSIQSYNSRKFKFLKNIFIGWRLANFNLDKIKEDDV